MDEFLIIEPEQTDGEPEPARAAARAGQARANAPRGERPAARVIGVAYTGGKMKLPGWRHPVVVDLAGLEIPEAVPLLTNHENRTGSRVGMVRARVEDDGLVIEGEILSSSGQAKGIIEQTSAGADWQLSIGAEVLQAELVRDRRTVNGQVQIGPFYHVQKSVLREVSVVAVGADMTTRMRVAASFHLYGGKTMEFEEWMEQHGIDPEKVDEGRMAELKAAFEAGQDPPTPRLRSAGPPGPEPAAALARAKRDENPLVVAGTQADLPTPIAAMNNGEASTPQAYKPRNGKAASSRRTPKLCPRAPPGPICSVGAAQDGALHLQSEYPQNTLHCGRRL